jgi:hypothetical protein
MTVEIIPEGRPPLPRGLLVRPLVLVALGAGLFVTFDAQSSFQRPGTDLGMFAAVMLLFAHLPFLAALPMLWRLGKSPALLGRAAALTVAAFLAGSSYLGLQDAFVLNPRPTSGMIFFLLPVGQLIVLAMLAGLVRWAGSFHPAEAEAGAEAPATG